MSTVGEYDVKDWGVTDFAHKADFKPRGQLTMLFLLLSRLDPATYTLPFVVPV